MLPSKVVLVPLLLLLSSALMALAWLGHLRFKHWSFGPALAASWFLVLPEYMLNIFAIRWGHGTFTGGQMAAINLSSGVICVAAVSYFILNESLSLPQMSGFALMIVAIFLIVNG